MPPENQHSTPAAESDRPPEQVEQQLGLLEGSFEQVLDATKHQDDKIGRLLTGIAFLTAATLALAALNSANYAARTFDVPPFTLPLGLVSISAFLLSVAVSVILLLAGLTQPLGLPGITDSGVAGSHTQYSQIYFLHISQMTREEWQELWRNEPEYLRRKRVDSLIKEIHSLAGRTTFKQDRSSEGVAVFSISLLAFAMSVILIASTVDEPQGKVVRLELFDRLALSLLFGLYFWLQLALRVRHERQEMTGNEEPAVVTLFRLRNTFAATSALLIVCTLIFARPWRAEVWLTVVIFAGITNLVILYWIVAIISRRERWARYQKIVPIVGTLILLGGAIVSGFNGWYAGQLLTVLVAVLALLVPTLLRPTLAFAKWRRDARARHADAQ
ncbi:hypothetical protein [Streptomyces sp. YU58]|uniref:hypothetical protein n=1 Tax=Streptomyces sp. SX92 TaxID=3158972 RepID=UPI0027BAA65F|nr:hypothetical protein [Streptomyces coralus]WLW55287.1 hypothetical protein QU709_29840 [Streptomyces coralus]